MLATVVLLGLTLLACPEPGTATAEATYPGVLLGDSVNVRAGPGSAYEVVAQLPGGSRVTVLGEAFGWLLIRPATDLNVYVSHELVEQKGDGIAVVTRDRVNLRA